MEKKIRKSSPDGGPRVGLMSLRTDKNGNILSASPHFLSILQKKRHELKGLSLKGLFPPAEAHKISSFFNDDSLQRVSELQLQMGYPAEGRKFLFSVYPAVEEEKTESTDAWTWMVKEETSEDEQVFLPGMDQYQHFSKLLSACPVAALVCDQEQFRILYANKLAEELLGYNIAALVQLHASDLLRGEKELAFLEAVQKGEDLLPGSTMQVMNSSGHWINTQWKPAELENRQGNFLLFYIEPVQSASHQDPLPKRFGIAQTTGRVTTNDLHALLSSLADIIFEYDLDYIYKGVWTRDESMLLQQPAELLGKSIRDIFKNNPLHLAESIADLDYVKHSGTVTIREYALELAGEKRWFRAKIAPLYEEQGKLKGFTKQITEITERKKVEQAIDLRNEAIRSAHQELAEIIEHATEIIFKIDLSGHFLFVSPEFSRSMGYAEAEVTGRSFFEFIHEEDQEACRERLGDSSRLADKSQQLMLRLRRKDGSYSWQNVSTSYIFSESGERLYMLGISQDVTSLKAVNISLHEARERYRMFIHQSSEGIWRFETPVPPDISMSPGEMVSYFAENGFLAECNDAYARMFGFSSATEITGTPLREMLPADKGDNLAFFHAFIESGYNLKDVETREYDKEGNARYFLNNLVGIIEDNKLLRVWGTQRDITAEKAALVALKESEARFRQLADTAPVMIWVSDEQDQTIYVNKSWKAYTGIEDCASVQVKWESIIHPDDKEATLEYYKTSFAKREPVTLEYRLRSVSGDYKWVIDKGEPRFLEDGQFLGYVGTVMDIHDRRTSEEALRKSEEKYRSLVEAMGEGIIMQDSNENIMACNKRAELILGLPASELLGRKISGLEWNCIHEDGSKFPEDQYPSYQTFHSGQALENVVLGIIHPREGLQWLSVNTAPIYYSKVRDKPDAVVASFVDITEKKIREKALQKSEKQLREYSGRIMGILDSITDGFIAIDRDMQVVLWNHVLVKLTGIRSGFAIGKKITDLFPKLAEEPVFQQYLQAMERRETLAMEHYYSDGDLWFETSSYSSEQGLFVYFRDITSRKRQEAFLSLEKRVLEVNARQSSSLQGTIDYFLEGIEQILPGAVGNVLMLDEDQETLRHLSGPSMPEAFIKQISGIKIGPRAGSCGTAAFRKEEVIVEDIASSPLWADHLELTNAFVFRSCWSFPVINANNKVLATFAIYFSQSKAPVSDERSFFQRVTHILRVIIENKRSEAIIRQTNERYLLATMATNDAIWDWDVETDNLYWGEGFYSLFGYRAGNYTGKLGFWERQIHPQDRERVVKGIQQFCTGRQAQLWEDEYRFMRSDGKYVLVYDRGFLIFNQQGKVSRMVGSMQDITEKREMEKRLLRQELNKQKLVAQAVVEAQEKERALIGKELHDNVNQILSTAKLYLELADNDENDRTKLIGMSTANIMDAINEIRAISRSLVPSSIDDLGLIDSINDLIESIRATRKLKISFHHYGDIDSRLNEQQKLMLFRITQEQVNNTLKHAQASQLNIELLLDEAFIYLTIQDDGVGFDYSKVRGKKGIGLSNMASRAELFNGKINMITAPGKGCTLQVTVPI